MHKEMEEILINMFGNHNGLDTDSKKLAHSSFYEEGTELHRLAVERESSREKELA